MATTTARALVARSPYYFFSTLGTGYPASSFCASVSVALCGALPLPLSLSLSRSLSLSISLSLCLEKWWIVFCSHIPATISSKSSSKQKFPTRILIRLTNGATTTKIPISFSNLAPKHKTHIAVRITRALCYSFLLFPFCKYQKLIAEFCFSRFQLSTHNARPRSDEKEKKKGNYLHRKTPH